jgi:hypothetical protein
MDITMGKNYPFFPWLGIIGMIFILLFCRFFSGMAYISNGNALSSCDCSGAITEWRRRDFLPQRNTRTIFALIRWESSEDSVFIVIAYYVIYY